MKARSCGLATVSRSGWVLAATCVHAEHDPHGSSWSSGRVWQSNVCASLRANVCLPTPAGPTNRKLPDIRPRPSAERNRSTRWSCPSIPCQAIISPIQSEVTLASVTGDAEQIPATRSRRRRPMRSTAQPFSTTTIHPFARRRAEEPRMRQPPGTFQIQGRHIEDPETDPPQLADQLPSGEGVEEHLGHAAVVEEFVAPFDFPVQRGLDAVSNDPTPAKTIKQVEPVIVHMEHE